MQKINGYDYSILADFFPERVIEEFQASAINPRLCLLNAESLNGDKAIAELLPNATETHTNSGSLRKTYRDRYASIIEHGGISYTGIDIEGDCIASCNSFKPRQPRLDKEGKPIKYDNPVKKASKAFLPLIDGETWQAISKRVGVDLPVDVDADRQWESGQIGSDEWKKWCKDLSLKFLEWIKGNPEINITITEGAKKSLSGTSTGEICISLSGIWNGCPEENKGAKDYTLISDLKLIAAAERNITIAFDKDSKSLAVNMVRMATKRLAALLIAEKCNVYEAKWDSEKGKGIDDLIFNHGVKTFYKAIDGASPIKPSNTNNENSGTENEELKKDKERHPTLLELAKVATYFHTADKVAYTDISIEGNRHTYAVKSRAFKLWLTGEHYRANKAGISSQSFQDTLPTLEAIAIFDGESREVHLRVAEYQSKLYLDLGTPDWKAIEIDAIGWRVISEPPIRFSRPDSLLPLPYPVEGGSLTELKDLLNVDGSSWTLIITFLLFCFCPDKTYPVLVLAAHRGSGKTAAAEILKGLIDPGKAGLIKLQGDTHKLAIAATRRHLMVYDNVGHISPDQSDDLCRVATGFGYSTRTLHTTEDETTFEFTRPQIITAIDALVTRDDLADRVLMAQLPEIPEHKRLPQGKLNEKVESAKPRILGALLTALSRTLAELPNVNPDKLPRMADYAQFAIASEKALGMDSGEFMEVFNESREQSRQVVIESSPLGEAIIRLMENYPIPKSWKGTASQLLKELENHTDDATYRSRFFPKASHSLTRQLNRLSPDLRAMGIDVQYLKDSGKERTRYIYIQKEVKIASEASEASDNNTKASQGEAYRADAIADGTADGTLKADGTLEADAIDFHTVRNSVRSQTTSEQGLLEISDASDAISTPLPVSGEVEAKKIKVGDRVQYIGTNPQMRKQYAGILAVHEIGKFGDSCACLTPDGKVSTWIEYSALELAEVA